ncbi:O-antigen ligase family protein [Streptomyces sp. V4I2]|uniref:O-antigen ligase family protein n=1 Tax=Streptomyces sp. V4I2 TaxID=3042280 RepID=UPI00277DCF1E|nr:O-antigen ligase family protein [Streptomyces sp. V4I2]MDQ1048318.1 hypothetical protein [Streptomyces sp. V4I2]
MRTRSREAVLVMACAAVFVVLVTALGIVTSTTGPAEVAVLVLGSSPAWLPTVALTAVAVLAALVLSPTLLLAGAVVAGHGLGIAALQEPLAGPLVISDLLLLAHLLASFAKQRIEKAALFAPVCRWLGLFLAWSFLATASAGAPITPLLRISVYAAVFVLLSNHPIDRTLMYGAVLCYALVNLVGGVLLGQSRLIGLDIGDPAQMGALLLAALCPLLTTELRFTGRWVVGAMLLGGIFLTQTRSVWFATTVVLVVWAQRKVSLVRIGAILLVLALLGLGTVDLVTRWFGLNPFSGDLRTLSMINGIHAGMQEPLFGAGWGRISFVDWAGASVPPSPDPVMPYNLLVGVFASVGLPAALLLLLFLGELLRRLAPQRGTPLLFTVGVLAMSLTEMTFYAGSMLTVLFFVYAGMGLGREPRGLGIDGTPTPYGVGTTGRCPPSTDHEASALPDATRGAPALT